MRILVYSHIVPVILISVHDCYAYCGYSGNLHPCYFISQWPMGLSAWPVMRRVRVLASPEGGFVISIRLVKI